MVPIMPKIPSKKNEYQSPSKWFQNTTQYRGGYTFDVSIEMPGGETTHYEIRHCGFYAAGESAHAYITVSENDADYSWVCDHVGETWQAEFVVRNGRMRLFIEKISEKSQKKECQDTISQLRIQYIAQIKEMYPELSEDEILQLLKGGK